MKGGESDENSDAKTNREVIVESINQKQGNRNEVKSEVIQKVSLKTNRKEDKTYCEEDNNNGERRRW